MPNILYALGDPARLRIVQQLTGCPDGAGGEVSGGVSCQQLVVDGVAKSTQSHQFKVLREAGVIRMVPQGRRVLVSLRGEDLDARFPGLLQAVLEANARQSGMRSDDDGQVLSGRRYIDLMHRRANQQVQVENAR